MGPVHHQEILHEKYLQFEYPSSVLVSPFKYQLLTQLIILDYIESSEYHLLIYIYIYKLVE
jgi:hypothetical protein